MGAAARLVRMCVIAVALAASVLLMTACSEGTPSADKPTPPKDTTETSSAPAGYPKPARFPGGFPPGGGGMHLEERAKLLSAGLQRLDSLEAAKARWSGARFPSETLGGKPGYIGIHTKKTGGDLCVLYDNGLFLYEHWYSPEPKPDPQARARSIEPTGQRFYYGGPRNQTIYELHVDGVDATGGQRGVFVGSVHGDVEQPSHVNWRKDRVDYDIGALDIPLEDLLLVADSMH